jgi:thiamine-phosphate pyrophosphorylase
MQPLGRLHIITDSLSIVDAVLAAGAPVVQVRAKGRTDRDVYRLVLAVAVRCRAAGAACVVDDRVDVAAAVGAALGMPVGAHVGADDLPVAAARAVLGPAAPLGATARNAVAAQEHQAAGASYVGAGPAYRTATKDGLPPPLGPDRIGEIAASVAVPVIAIGGVTAGRARALRSAGVYGIAVVGAVCRAADPAAATRDLLAATAAESTSVRGAESESSSPAGRREAPRASRASLSSARSGGRRGPARRPGGREQV